MLSSSGILSDSYEFESSFLKNFSSCDMLSKTGILNYMLILRGIIRSTGFSSSNESKLFMLVLRGINSLIITLSII